MYSQKISSLAKTNWKTRAQLRKEGGGGGGGIVSVIGHHHHYRPPTHPILLLHPFPIFSARVYGPTHVEQPLPLPLPGDSCTHSLLLSGGFFSVPASDYSVSSPATATAHPALFGSLLRPSFLSYRRQHHRSNDSTRTRRARLTTLVRRLLSGPAALSTGNTPLCLDTYPLSASVFASTPCVSSSPAVHFRLSATPFPSWLCTTDTTGAPSMT